MYLGSAFPGDRWGRGRERERERERGDALAVRKDWVRHYDSFLGFLRPPLPLLAKIPTLSLHPDAPTSAHSTRPSACHALRKRTQGPLPTYILFSTPVVRLSE